MVFYTYLKLNHEKWDFNQLLSHYIKRLYSLLEYKVKITPEYF